MTADLAPAVLTLFGKKSHSKKLFFSVRRGRKQVSMLLDNAEEGRLLEDTIGGYVGKKIRSEPRGAWEWYYHGRELLSLCERIHPVLNYFQQNYVGGWLEADKLAREPKLDL